jgi:predicted small metal-binding protein
MSLYDLLVEIEVSHGGRRKMPTFKCADIGMSCGFEASAKTQDKLMKKISKHASKVHDIKTISPDLMDQITKAIKE